MTSSASFPIIVVGMHRSGTSMLTRLLEQAGLFMGAKKRTDDEAVFFLEINEWLQRSAGGEWDNPDNMVHLLRHTEYRALATDYIRCLTASRHAASYLGIPSYLRYRTLHNLDFPWGWKDPRNSYSLPLWLDIFPNAKVLHIYRNGIDVAQSLRVRAQKQLAESATRHQQRKTWHLYWLKAKRTPFTGSLRCLDLEYAFNLWVRYTEAALENVEHARTPSLSVKYEDFLIDPSHWLRNVVEFCELEVSAERLASLASQVKKDRAYAYKTTPELAQLRDYARQSPLFTKLGYD